MEKITFLTSKFSMGWGVGLMVEKLVGELSLMGHVCHVVTMDGGYNLQAEYVSYTTGNISEVQDAIDVYSPDVLVAITSPFFEMLPLLDTNAQRIVWEAGDPTPELFGSGRFCRQQIIDHKKLNIYPNVDGVIALSEFIKHDIDWPTASPIYIGCDHAPRFADKQPTTFGPQRPLKVGALMRLGPGEALYKGNRQLIELQQILQKSSINFEMHIAGRGNPEDVVALENLGFVVKLNLTEQEKFEYLRQLDIFVSLSMWEGFNLPLVEAQIVGTLALALDVGAHPEVCPLVARSVPSLALYILNGYRNPIWLAERAKQGKDFVQRKFSWRRSALELKKFIAENQMGSSWSFYLGDQSHRTQPRACE